MTIFRITFWHLWHSNWG